MAAFSCEKKGETHVKTCTPLTIKLVKAEQYYSETKYIFNCSKEFWVSDISTYY